MRAGGLKACIIPVAAIEQHLEHMAMEHDWRSACTVAEAVAAQLRPHVLVAEGLMAGVSEHHMRHPGTLSLRPGTFLAVLADLIDSEVRAGFRNVLVLNGHGGNKAPINGAWEQFLRMHQVNLHFLCYWEVLTAADARELLKGGERDDFPGHAQEFETAIGLAAFPENVRTNMWKDQIDQKPALATAPQGKELMKRIVERVAKYVAEMINGERVAKIPDFYP
ncbi:MAG: creatininase family protein [Opitutaceae bacterium]|nr:creatininase family protein [Opitutaceae bacterium]